MKKIIFVFALMCTLGVTRAQDSIPRPQPQRVLRVLITSFTSHWECNPNPSQLLMTYVQGYYSRKNVEVSFQILEDSLQYCKKWINHTDMNNYDLVVHTGVDEMANVFELEKYARKGFGSQLSDIENDTCGNSDEFGNGPVMYTANIDLDSLVKKAQYSECMMISEDAGSYLCNFIYYLTSDNIAQHSIPADVIFIHIPPFENIRLEEQYSIFENLLDLLIEYEYFKLPSRK